MNAPVPFPEQRLFSRYPPRGPRYTSYPTADRFQSGFGEAQYREAMRVRGELAAPGGLSLYAHIPFCRSLCWYCACNKVITKDTSRAAAYLDDLKLEIRFVAQALAGERRVTQVHFGGGTPTYLTHGQLGEILDVYRAEFELDPKAEIAIEVDPRTVDYAYVAALGKLGFNRMSLGVQDFDRDVQGAIHRFQSPEQTLGVLDAAREHGFESVSLDMVYGLPRQTLASFDATLAVLLAARPDRVALYSYAHLPERFKPQRRIRDEDMPEPEVKLAMMRLAQERLVQAGYVSIGLDHFALPGDELAQAGKQGGLQRNFQGYSTRGGTDMLAFGVSAISQVGAIYSQNVYETDAYHDALAEGRLPVARGLNLSRDDLIRRAVIQGLMCQMALSKEAVAHAYLIDFDGYFAPEIERLRALEADGLVHMDREWIEITELGRFFLRAIAMVFDRYLSEAKEPPKRFSRLV
jgi:oxygen-independent coproporphyrinogen-3 oxidase